MDGRCDSSGRAFALETYSPEFKLQSYKKKKKEKEYVLRELIELS
jgi:hypothetical protein